MRRNCGFSLIELIVTITIFAILLAIALPAWSAYVANNKLKLTRDGLASSIDNARQMALADDNNVTLCPFSATGSTSCGTSWSSGWIVFEQTTASGNVLIQSTPAPSNTQITVTPVNAAVTSFTFNPKPPFLNQATDFRLCDARGASSAMSLSVQLTGYAQTGQTQGYAVDGVTALSCP